ncbi:hypothetical protein GAYE_SCF00G1852 [Galdieria yellowstonensis]|uniref:Uncharacterized protein n=1 Tax=Galdieria yellowstonensis TaxID=3028027 RepID=A0AAV9I9K1_9RHOD|nr:hypothetical protein GAYE_SCF00G1852 [Galdieria yellowstonensis]
MNKLPRLPKEVDELGTTQTTAKVPFYKDSEEENMNNSSEEDNNQVENEPDSGHSASTPIPISSQSTGKPLLSSKVESLGFSTTEGEGTLLSIVSPRVFLPADTPGEESSSFVSSYSKLKQEQEMSKSFDWAGSFMESEPLFTQKEGNSDAT